MEEPIENKDVLNEETVEEPVEDVAEETSEDNLYL